MVTKSEMRGIQGWFLKRLGCFSINQLSPSLSALRYAIDLIEKREQLVVFPEGKINRYGKKLAFLQFNDGYLGYGNFKSGPRYFKNI